MRAFWLILSVAVYAFFLIAFLYLIGFVGNLPTLPVTVDRGPDTAPMLAAVIDVALIALFGVQHSVMARQGFKRGMTSIVPAPLERSVYVLASTVVLCVLCGGWQPIPAILWSTEGTVATLLWLLFGVGWGLLLLSTFLINHFELFGLQQTWLHWRGASAAPPKFRTPFLYRMVRHPLYLGFVIAFWAAPVMTVGHALLAAGMTAYILIGVHYEERDLIGFFGAEYRAYRAQVGAVIPGLGRVRE